MLEPTELRLYPSGESDVVRYAQGEGFLQVSEEGTLILVDEVFPVDDLDVSRSQGPPAARPRTRSSAPRRTPRRGPPGGAREAPLRGLPRSSRRGPSDGGSSAPAARGPARACPALRGLAASTARRPCCARRDAVRRRRRRSSASACRTGSTASAFDAFVARAARPLPRRRRAQQHQPTASRSTSRRSARAASSACRWARSPNRSSSLRTLLGTRIRAGELVERLATPRPAGEQRFALLDATISDAAERPSPAPLPGRSPRCMAAARRTVRRPARDRRARAGARLQPPPPRRAGAREQSACRRRRSRGSCASTAP